MAIEQKYSPVQRVNIGPGKDTLNDFARKYNLEIENIYDLLNKYTVSKVVFYGTSSYWSSVNGGYRLSLPHNGNIVFAVYKTISTTESEQVFVGVSMNATNVMLESVTKFDGFMLYAAINEELGITPCDPAVDANAAAIAARDYAREADAIATALTNIYNDAISSGQIVAPAVDPTLSISGAAADAKVTGHYLYGMLENGWESVTVTITSGKYLHVGATPSNADGKEQSYAPAGHTEMIPVSEGDKFKVTAKSYTNIPAVVYYSGTTFTHDDYVSCDLNTGNNYANEEITVPAGASYVAFQSSPIADYPISIQKLSNVPIVDRLEEEIQTLYDRIGEVKEYQSVALTETYGKYAHVGLTPASADGTEQTYAPTCHSQLIPVVEGDKFKVSSKSSLNVPLAVYYSSNEMNHANYVSAVGVSADATVYVDYEITVPSGVSYVVFNSADYTNNPLSVSYYDYVSVADVLDEIKGNDIKQKSYFVSLQNDNLYVVKKYAPTHDLILNMIRGGVNQLFEINNIGIINNTEDYVLSDLSSTVWLQTTATDWISPYKFKAVNDADGYDTVSLHFSGGFHAYNGQATTGIAGSAEETRLYFRVDGAFVTEFTGYCNELDVYRIADIQASNTTKADGTGRTCLTEKVHWTFHDGRVDVETKLIPKEEIDFYLVYGLQMLGFTGTGLDFDGIYYRGSRVARGLQGFASGNCGDKNCRDSVFYGDDNIMSSHIDDFDLGDFYNDEQSFSAFFSLYTSSYGKLYYNLLNLTTPLRLSAGSMIGYRGWYKFEYNV